MALRRNLLLMGLTTVVRLGAGLLTFAVVARVLGPKGFGLFAVWLSVAALCTIATNYGLVPYVLRELGRDPAGAEQILQEGFTGKVMLASLVLLAGVLSCGAWGHGDARVFMPLLIAAIADCFAEFMGAGLRARGRFDVESRLVSASSLLHSAIMIGAVYGFQSVTVAAFAHGISRTLIAFATYRALSKHVVQLRLRPIRDALSRLRDAFAYALDYALQSLFGQVDSVVLNYFLGPSAVGSYQAGMRLYQTGAQTVGVFSNVFLPRVAARQGSSHEIGRENASVQMVFIVSGAVLGLAMAIFADVAVRTLLGRAYLPLVPLLPLFGLLFFLRFSASAWGILLTATGHQSYRTGCGLFYWVAIFGLAAWFVPLEGSRGWLLSLCTATLLLILGYAWRGRRMVEHAWLGLVLPLGAGVPLLLLAVQG